MTRAACTKIPFLEGDKVSPDEAGNTHPACKTYYNHYIPDGRLQNGNHGKYQEKCRKTEHDINKTHNHRINPFPVISCKCTQNNPYTYGNAGCNKPHLQRYTGSPYHPAENVSPKLIRSEKVRPGRM